MNLNNHIQPHTTTFECHRLQEHTETCCSLHRNTAFMVSSLDGLSMVASCNGTEFCSERIWHCLAPTFNIFQSIPHVFLLPFLPHDFCPFLFDSYSTPFAPWKRQVLPVWARQLSLNVFHCVLWRSASVSERNKMR